MARAGFLLFVFCVSGVCSALLSTHADRHVVDISFTVCFLFVCLFVSLSAGFL